MPVTSSIVGYRQ